jgi:Icc-related predicted phosphoesterase
MTILSLADLHRRLDWFAWVAQESVNHDLVVFSGDLQQAFSNVGMHAQAKTISEFLAALTVPCVAVTGNHDFWTARGSIDRYAEGGWLRMLRGKGHILGVDGDTIEFHGLRVCCNGWLQVPDLNGPIDVLVTHAPPSGCQCASGAEGIDVGDPDIWPAVQEFPPTLVLSGHIHQPRRLTCTWPPIDPTSLILVPGCNEDADVPCHWVIDTDAKIATHSDGEVVRYG